VTPPLVAAVPRRRWSGAAIVVGLASTLVFAIFAIFALLCWQAFGNTVEQTKTKAQVAADVVADQLQWSMSASLTALRFIADLGEAAFDPANRPKIEAALDRLPSDALLALYDSTGTVHGDNNGLADTIGGEDFFAALKQGQNWLIVPVGKDTRYMLVAQRLGGANFVGVALLALPATLLEGFWASQSLGQDSTAVVNREDGPMVARYPTLAGPQTATSSPKWETIKSNPSGTYTIRSPIDGVMRVVAFRHIPQLGLIAFATISQDTAFATVWNSIFTVLWLLVPIALMLMVFALVIARMLAQSEGTNAKLAAALAHNDVLFREIHHRVKNNLQSVASLLQMQPIDRAIKTNMAQRIAAMSAVHEHIYRSGSFTTVQVKPYLETLIQNIRVGGDPKVRLSEHIEDLSVDKDAATPLGLILNEVLSNAFKHAFPEGRDGSITVRLAATGDGRGRLVVEDDGVGFDPAIPAKGIGQRLIRALTDQLSGTSEMTAGVNAGSRFELLFPLAKG
jgi:two-component sensor histidine kinase